MIYKPKTNVVYYKTDRIKSNKCLCVGFVSFEKILENISFSLQIIGVWVYNAFIVNYSFVGYLVCFVTYHFTVFWGVIHFLFLFQKLGNW